MSALISPKECPEKVQKCFEFKIRTSQICRPHTLRPLCDISTFERETLEVRCSGVQHTNNHWGPNFDYRPNL